MLHVRVSDLTEKYKCVFTVSHLSLTLTEIMKNAAYILIIQKQSLLALQFVVTINFQWWIQESLSFQFLSFSGSFEQNVCQIIGWLPMELVRIWEILDPPIISTESCIRIVLHFKWSIITKKLKP